jgi:Family of unknown function (DUF6291)
MVTELNKVHNIFLSPHQSSCCNQRNDGGILFNMKTNNNDENKPKGFFVNLDWYEPIQELDDAEAGQMFKNMFNYLLQRELIETSRVVNVISKMTVFPTLEYNVEKYKKTVERNRENGKLGGRKKDQNKNPEEPSQTQKNPVGFSENPEEAKDKERDKAIVKEKVIDKDIARDKINDKNIDKLTELRYAYLEKFRKLVQLNFDQIKEHEAEVFYVEVKELVNKLGWDKFFQIILIASKEELPSLINSFQIEDEENAIQNIRRNFFYFLGKMIK